MTKTTSLKQQQTYIFHFGSSYFFVVAANQQENTAIFVGCIGWGVS